MPIDRARTARGALAGAIAAGAWAAQQQLDKRVFGVDYDDDELLGKAVTRGPAWPAVGFALHLLNGAAFGAAYANVAPAAAAARRGRAARPLAMVEHLATWPVTVAVDRVHPARDELPGPVGQRPRLRPGHLAPPALRHRPGRARAPPQRARRHRRAALRARRLLQRPRRHRARRGRVGDVGGGSQRGSGPCGSTTARVIGRNPCVFRNSSQSAARGWAPLTATIDLNRAHPLWPSARRCCETHPMCAETPRAPR